MLLNSSTGFTSNIIDLASDTGMEGYTDITFYDVNQDGYLDVFAPGQGNTRIFVNNQDNTFQYFNISKHERAGLLFDIDLDGNIDIVGSDTFNLSGSKGSAGLVFANKTDFYTRLQFPGNSNYLGESKLIDFNGDGYLDILISDNTFNFDGARKLYVSIFQGNQTPSISVSSSLSNFVKCEGSASLSQSFNLTGSNLTSSVSISSLTNYEYSLDDSTFSNSLSISPSSGNVSATIYVRIKSFSSGSLSGNISITSSGATTRTIAVTGSVSTVTPPKLLQSSTGGYGGGNANSSTGGSGGRGGCRGPGA